MAADQVKVDAAIQRGQSYLTQKPKSGASGNLAWYVLVKSGIDKQNPALQQVVKRIADKINDGTYVPTQHHFYEAGVDLMLLQAISAEAHRPLMEPIVNYLIANQQPNGSWYYPGKKLEPDAGDTSITQYALLGLWAAARSGMDISPEVWEKAARWHIARQLNDGGFSYHPFNDPDPADLYRGKSTRTMTVAGAGSLLLARRMLFGDVEMGGEARPPNPNRRFGVLDRMADDNLAIPPQAKSLTLATIDGSVKKSIQWMTTHFAGRDAKLEDWFGYYYYGVERVAALHAIEKFGSADWYEEGSAYLLLRQQQDGSWRETHGDSIASTSLVLLFLMKVTTSTVTPVRRTPTVGGGLLAGGRGLPTNLDQIQVKDGLVAARKMQGPVDSLLVELERSSSANVEAVQAAVVEAVQVERSEDLFRQVDRLKKLVFDSRAEVRRTACWALGRAGDITAVPVLIQSLKDSDDSVMREASFGLSILSRKIEGCGLPLDPLDGLEEDASDAERQTHLERWATESVKRWQEWFQRIRPYDERDDRTQLKLK